MYILLDIIEYVMINSTSHQSWLFYSPLAKQAALLKDDLLDPVDQLLEDPALVDLVQQCLAARSPASAQHAIGNGNSAATWCIGGSPASMPKSRPISVPSAEL